LQYMLEKVQHDPVSVKMLKINGDDLIKKLKLTPGPKIGAILDVLLSEVIEEPKLNNRELLLKRAKVLSKMEIEQLRLEAKKVISAKQEAEDQDLKKQYKV